MISNGELIIKFNRKLLNRRLLDRKLFARNSKNKMAPTKSHKPGYSLLWLMCQSLMPILLLSLVVLSGCATVSPAAQNELPHRIDQAQQANTLYQRLGGHVVLERLVDNFVRGIAADKQVLPYFAKSNVTRFRLMFVEHLCEITDGPCQYQGDSMHDVHTGMRINEADFNRVVELLIIAMEQSGISYPLQNQLLAKLAPLRNGIIGI